MASILAHKVMSALLMLATSGICPEDEWYGPELDKPDTVYFVAQRCAVPLAPGMKMSDARAFYNAAKRLSR